MIALAACAVYATAQVPDDAREGARQELAHQVPKLEHGACLHPRMSGVWYHCLRPQVAEHEVKLHQDVLVRRLDVEDRPDGDLHRNREHRAVAELGGDGVR